MASPESPGTQAVGETEPCALYLALGLWDLVGGASGV